MWSVSSGNHTGYKQWKGRRTPAEEIQELYDGLKQANLATFDMMLSGYAASKDAVKAVGNIGRDLKLRANMKPGSFFWSESAPSRPQHSADVYKSSIQSWATKAGSMSRRISSLCTRT